MARIISVNTLNTNSDQRVQIVLARTFVKYGEILWFSSNHVRNSI